MLVEEQFESVFHKVAFQATEWWLTPSLLSSTGSQRVSAGCPGWADFPEEEKGRTWHSLFCTCFNQQSRASWALLYMPETTLLHRVVSDVKQSEKARRPNLISARAAIFRVRSRAWGLDSDLGDSPLNSVGQSEQAEVQRLWQGSTGTPCRSFLWQAGKAGVFHNCLNEQVPLFPFLSLFLSFSAVLDCWSTTAQ